MNFRFLPFSRAALAASAASLSLHSQPALSTGHADLGLAFEDGVWDLHVHDEETDTEFEPERVVLEVGSAGHATVPDDPRYAWLGAPGDSYWALPATAHPDLLFLGLGTEEIEPGIFANNRVDLTLEHLVGPGQVFLFRTDAFGNPEVFFNSVDGIDEADLYPAATGAHAHLVWAFSTAGTYRVAVRAAGVLVANGSRSRSAPAEYVFQVRPAALERGHVDIHLAWNAEAGGTLDLAVRDSARGQRFATNEVLLVAGEAAQLTLPDGTPFGAGGDPLWVLPQSEDPGLPYLGFSTDGVPVGVFNGSLRYQLEVVEGPGDFFLWQAEVGGFAVQMNTTDGIDASDVLELTAGGHSHHNWGFTQPGVYHVLLRAEGVLAGSGTEAGSNLLGLTFELAPLPDPLNFAQWQHRFWPTWVPDSIKGRTADPDGNGLVNAMAYALNLHPLVPVSGGRPEAVLIDVGGALYPGLAFTRVKAAGDIVYEVVADDGLPWNAPTPVDTVVSVADHGATETVTMRDAASLPVGGARFLQLRVRWP